MKKEIGRVLALLLGCAMLLGFAACAVARGDAPATTAAKTADASTAAQTTAVQTTGAQPETVELKIVSMNAQNAAYDKSGEATLEEKHQKLADAISAKSPDLVLLQESDGLSAKKIRDRVQGASNYAFASAADATTALVYNTEVFELLGKGSEKIGEKDDSDGSRYDRYLVWAELLHKESGEKVVVVPLHVDFVTKACKAQIDRIVEYLKTNFPGETCILGGDFNAEVGTVSATSLSTEGYQNAAVSAAEKVKGNAATFPEKGTVIDFVWYKGGTGVVAAAAKYEVITDKLPTDHRPLYVELLLTK